MVKENDDIRCNVFLLIYICQSDEYFEFLQCLPKEFLPIRVFLCIMLLGCVCVCVCVFHLVGFHKINFKMIIWFVKVWENTKGVLLT